MNLNPFETCVMSKPVNVVMDYRTPRNDMRDTINEALPRRNPVLGIVIGFACTLVVLWGAFSLLVQYASGG